MQLVSAFDNSSVYFYPISAQQATRMRCLGIVMVILAISGIFHLINQKIFYYQ